MQSINLLSSNEYHKNLDRIFIEIMRDFNDKASRYLYFCHHASLLNKKTTREQENIIFAAACLFNVICKLHSNILVKNNEITEDSKKIILNIQENLRSFRYYIKANFKNDMAYNHISNQVHSKSKAAYIKEKLLTKFKAEIESCVKVEKIKKLCEKYEKNIPNTKVVKKDGYEEITFSSERIFFNKIKNTVHDKTFSNNQKLKNVKTSLGSSVVKEMINKTEDKTFKNFAKNLIKTVFGIKCLFGSAFWQHKKIISFSLAVKQIDVPVSLGHDVNLKNS